MTDTTAEGTARRRADKWRRYRARHPERVAASAAATAARRAARTPEEVAADRTRLHPSGKRPCPACRRMLAFAAFHSNRSRPDGLASVCVECAREARAARSPRPSSIP